MYKAEDDKVFVSILDDRGSYQHFLTVHPTDSGPVSVEEQAQIIARMLNEATQQ